MLDKDIAVELIHYVLFWCLQLSEVNSFRAVFALLGIKLIVLQHNVVHMLHSR